MKQLCKLCNIKIVKKPLHTTPKQIEHWKGGMVHSSTCARKCSERQTEWDLILNYFLFAYHNSPHTNTSFSPFEVVYGRELHGPLELLHEGWIDGRMPSKNVIDWVNDLADHLKPPEQLLRREKWKLNQPWKTVWHWNPNQKLCSGQYGADIRSPEMRGKLKDIWRAVWGKQTNIWCKTGNCSSIKIVKAAGGTHQQD